MRPRSKRRRVFYRSPIARGTRQRLSLQVSCSVWGSRARGVNIDEAPTMKTAQGVTLIANGRLVDGTGAAPVRDAAVVVKDGRIAYAGPARGAPTVPPDAERIDARGGTIMPGLVEAHFHPTYFNVAELADLDIKYPVEYVTLLAACNARLALECGYTAARSGGSLHNIDVWLKKAIEEDLFPGPRLAASGREICGAGGLMDWNPEHLKLGMEGLILLINGPDEGRAAVRKLVKDGVEWIKTYPTGDAAAPDTADHHTLCMTFEEMAAVVAEAHNYHRKVTGHCRATQGIKNALRAGFDCARARHVHGRRGARHAARAEHAGRPRPPVRVGEHRARPGVRHAPGGHRRPQGDARRRRRECPDDPQGRRPARHGGRLRLRLEPARRLRQGADLLRQVRRLLAAGDDHLRDQDRRRDHGPRATSSAPSSRASSPTCWSSTATSSPTSRCSRTARGSSP